MADNNVENRGDSSWGKSGFSLIQLLVGATLSIAVMLIIAQGFRSNDRATALTVSRQKSQMSLRELIQRLRRDVQRSRPGGISLISGVYSGSSGCMDLRMEQTILPNSVQTIEYQTECVGPDFSIAATRDQLYDGLGNLCQKFPQLRVTVTQPDGVVKVQRYPARGFGDAALVCFRQLMTGAGVKINAEIVLAKRDGDHWKKLIETIPLGADDPGPGLELIPPQ